MKADARFLRQNNSFWAHVRSISQHIGYTDRRTGRVKIPTANEIIACLNDLKLRTDHLFAKPTKPTAMGKRLLAYFAYRADLLNQIVEPQLMNASDAQAIFEKLQTELKPQCPLPMNKQKGDKKASAYLTGIVNMLIESATADVPCDYDPRELVTVTADGVPRYTFARRFDGAFPSTVNPIAVWEIKEYYHTTTFGSRVADGVYETLLDGLELEEVKQQERIGILHYLIIDAHFTWWVCGRSYLCRIVDMLNMGYVTEVLVGREVLTRLPMIVKEDWLPRL